MINTNNEFVELFQLSDDICQKIKQRTQNSSQRYIVVPFYREDGNVCGYLRIGLLNQTNNKLGMLYMKGLATVYNNHAQVIILCD